MVINGIKTKITVSNACDDYENALAGFERQKSRGRKKCRSG